MIGYVFLLAFSLQLSNPPRLRSESVVVRLADTHDIVIVKNADTIRPIASITKLMSALLLQQHRTENADRLITITDDDKDKRKWSRSRLFVGATMPWGKLMEAALGASDNRAMYAAVRGAGFGQRDFVSMMNNKARALGMQHTHFADAAGLDPGNKSTARDLLNLIDAAAKDAGICQDTQRDRIHLTCARTKRQLKLNNPDRLARSVNWDLVLGKTGYTIEAGRALVTRVRIDGRPVDMVFLGAREMHSVFGDASRVRDWLRPQLHNLQASVFHHKVTTCKVNSDCL
jgi:serine-type D-Ala-D-Ala endopeptidase (penicillin-binding protein 7)